MIEGDGDDVSGIISNGGECGFIWGPLKVLTRCGWRLGGTGEFERLPPDPGDEVPCGGNGGIANPSAESRVPDRVGDARIGPLFGPLKGDTVRAIVWFVADREDDVDGVRVEEMEFILFPNSETPAEASSAAII
jgi:hypothetical protein